MTTVRCYSLEERYVSFIKLFRDTWSGLIAVVKTFASVKKSVQFVDVTCGAEARPAALVCVGTVSTGNVTAKVRDETASSVYHLTDMGRMLA